MTEELKLTAIIPASPKEIYEAWMNSKKHSAMTGSEAKVDPRVDGVFTAWDEYIEGKTLKLELNQRIVQKWRTTEFPEDAPDSNIELILEKTEDGTRLTLIHTDIPAGQSDNYKQGWDDFYFVPMRSYFEKSSSK
jgi:activator of HSP90 ATPase